MALDDEEPFRIGTDALVVRERHLHPVRAGAVPALADELGQFADEAETLAELAEALVDLAEDDLVLPDSATSIVHDSIIASKRVTMET